MLDMFPEREFFMRSQGQVRFIKISTRVQLIAASIAMLLLVGWLVTMAGAAIWQYTQQSDRLALIDREAKVASAESRVDAYRDDIGEVATDLQRRQQFVEQMVEAHLGELPAEVEASASTVSDSSGESARTIDKVSAAIPEAAGLARLEARQLAFVERLTHFADRRAERAAAAIRKLGLNPNAMLAVASGDSARGGPLMSLATDRDGSLDPRFHRLGLSLARMDALERSLKGIPQHDPANKDFISSGFGYRADPFTGGAAFHSGLDFRGPRGAPIYAAASGTVSFAGVKAGYGKTIEIDHGNGLMTRYAHMSRHTAVAGQRVRAGSLIGAIGSTGRSTGPHLHFEVRVDGRAVNPKPFLETPRHVHEEKRAGE